MQRHFEQNLADVQVESASSEDVDPRVNEEEEKQLHSSSEPQDQWHPQQSSQPQAAGAGEHQHQVGGAVKLPFSQDIKQGHRPSVIVEMAEAAEEEDIQKSS